MAGAAGAHLVAIVNQHASGKAMSYEGFGAGDPVAALPYVTKNAGPIRWSSQIFATNIGPRSDVTVTLFDTSGNVAAARTYNGVEPGISVMYDLVSEASLPDGIHSALVRSDQGVVAVVDHTAPVQGADAALSYGSTAASATGAPPPPSPTTVVTPTPAVPTAPPTTAPTPTAPPPTIAPTAAPVAGSPTARRYSMAFVLVVPAGTSSSTIAALTNLSDGIAAIFPDHWAAATAGLSAMTTARTYVIVDTAGTLLAQPRLDTTATADLFYQTHGDDHDFITYFQFKDIGWYDHHTHQQSEPGTYHQAPSYMPRGVTRLKGHNVISISPRYYAQQLPKSYIQVLLHETHHQWCCYVTTPSGFGLASDALTPREAGYVHWSAWLLTAPRPKYPIVGGDASGWGWRDNGDGSYTIDCTYLDPGVPGNYAFPKLGLLVMGLTTADQVPPIEILAGIGDPRPGVSTPTCGTYRFPKVTIPISALVDANPYLRR